MSKLTDSKCNLCFFSSPKQYPSLLPKPQCFPTHNEEERRVKPNEKLIPQSSANYRLSIVHWPTAVLFGLMHFVISLFYSVLQCFISFFSLPLHWKEHLFSCESRQNDTHGTAKEENLILRDGRKIITFYCINDKTITSTILNIQRQQVPIIIHTR